jgi:hypothetical protein
LTTSEHVGTTFTLTATGGSSGRTASATFTDGGSMNYSPNNQTLNIQTDANPQSAGFSQTVGAPRCNGSSGLETVEMFLKIKRVTADTLLK